MPLRKCDFYNNRALCRDVRRKLELWVDPAALHTVWDRTWNQWKHLVGAKVEIEGTFVQSGKYRKHRAEWELVTWETALPSRLEVKLPADFQQQLETAKTTYHRFGQYSRALDQIRLCLNHRAVERAELQRMCSEMRIPADFDIAQISWRPDYEPFFYRQLARRARRIYLFGRNTFSTLRKPSSSKPHSSVTRPTCLPSPGTWIPFSLCTPRSRKTTSVGTAIMQPSGWAFWGASFTAPIRERGSRKSGNVSGKKLISQRP